jgi:lambda repressor-like predicted transcriptional regulator
MNRTVNLDLLDLWLGKNGGISVLSEKSHVSISTIRKLKNRYHPSAPKKRATQLLIADAMNVEVDELFPVTANHEGRAS